MSMLLVSAFGCATMTGINNGCLSLEKTLNAYMREGGYPHAVITTDVTKRKEMDKLLSLDGIEAVSARLVGDGIMISPEGRYLSARLISFDEDDIQKIYVEDQAEPNGFDSAYSAYKTILSGTKIIAMVLVGMAMAIGLVIVVNTSHTNLLEQKKELCVLRTLGFQHSEISRYWFFQSILHFLVSCAFGFPAGIALSKSTIQQLEMTQRTYTFVNNPMDYALTAFFVLCYIVLSHFLTMRALKKRDIVEVVKERE